MYFFSKEADDIDRKPEKMKIYKAGYNAEKGYKDRHTGFGRNTQSWNTFCFKAFTAEEASDSNTSKGFIDRTFIFRCIRGDPAYSISNKTRE
jgi:phage terminase large subunit-like protein